MTNYVKTVSVKLQQKDSEMQTQCEGICLHYVGFFSLRTGTCADCFEEKKRKRKNSPRTIKANFIFKKKKKKKKKATNIQSTENPTL